MQCEAHLAIALRTPSQELRHDAAVAFEHGTPLPTQTVGVIDDRRKRVAPHIRIVELIERDALTHEPFADGVGQRTLPREKADRPLATGVGSRRLGVCFGVRIAVRHYRWPTLSFLATLRVVALLADAEEPTG